MSTAHGSHGGMAAVAISSPAASPASHRAGAVPAASSRPPGPRGHGSGRGVAGQRGEQHRNGGDRLGHRAGHRVMPEFLAGDHDIGEAGAETTVALGHRQRGDS